MAYNITRQNAELLKQHAASPASLAVQLYSDHWTLNSGSKFLYNSPAAALLDDIRAHRIPIDLLELFDAAKVPFYEGCMIVELQDYRLPRPKDKKGTDESKAQPETMRVVLRPNEESFWADLCLLNQKAGGKWTDQDALEAEARILVATAPPLCLDPNPHLGRVANKMLRISTPRTPAPLRPRKRKAATLDQPENDEATAARRAKLMQFMNPQRNRSMTPTYRLLDAMQMKKAKQAEVVVALAAAAPPVPAPSESQTQPQTPFQHLQQIHPKVLQQPPQLQPRPPQPPPQRVSSTPAPPAPAAAAPTPTPGPVAGPSDTKRARHAAKRDGQTPSNATDGTAGTPTPAPTPISATPQLAPQQLRPVGPSPHPPSQSPHPAVAVYASSPRDIIRPAPSPAQHIPSQSPRPPAPQPTPVQHQPYPQQPSQPYPAGVPQPYTQLTQAQLQAVYAKGKAQAKNPSQLPGAHSQMTPAQVQAYTQMRQMQHQLAMQQQQQRLAAGQGQANQTAATSRSPMVQNKQPAANGSPMVANQQAPARSPMPGAQQQTPQQGQQHPGMPHAQLNYQIAQQQYNAQMRAAMQNAAAMHNQGQLHPHPLAAAAAQAQAQAGGQTASPAPGQQQRQGRSPAQGATPEQQQALQHAMLAQYPQMFNFPPQMGMNPSMQMGRMPPQYAGWQMGYGRGVPPGAQHAMPGAGGAQVPMNMNKAAQGGGAQGR